LKLSDVDIDNMADYYVKVVVWCVVVALAIVMLVPLVVS